MTTEELDRLAELEKAATPGPWTAQKNNTPMVKSDFGALVLHSDAAEQLAAKDAEIEWLNREVKNWMQASTKRCDELTAQAEALKLAKDALSASCNPLLERSEIRKAASEALAAINALEK